MNDARPRRHTDALQAMGGDGLTIRHNVIRDVSQGILLKDGSGFKNVRVSENSIHEVGSFGLSVYDGSNIDIERNLIWGTQYGLFAFDDARYRGGTRALLMRNVVDRVNFFDGARLRRGSEGNIVRTYRRVGARSRLGRPRFRNSARDDYRISERRPGLRLSPRSLPGVRFKDADLLKR